MKRFIKCSDRMSETDEQLFSEISQSLTDKDSMVVLMSYTEEQGFGGFNVIGWFPYNKDVNTPQEVPLEVADFIVDTYKPEGLFYAQCDNGGYLTIDNTSGQAYAEYLKTKELAIAYLNGEIELGDDGEPAIKKEDELTGPLFIIEFNGNSAYMDCRLVIEDDLIALIGKADGVASVLRINRYRLEITKGRLFSDSEIIEALKEVINKYQASKK